jgi:hypothetical protein
MPLSKGMLLIASFALTWGVFAGMNIALLRLVAGLPLSALPVVASIVLAFLETLVLVEFVDRRFLRGRAGTRHGASIFTRDLLDRVPLFRGGDPLLLNRISQMLRPRTIEAGQLIVKMGEPGTEMFLICRGEVSVLNGQGKVLNTLKDGDCFGEIGVLISTPRTASVRANSLCDLFVLEKADFNRILREQPKFAAMIQVIASERYNINIGTEQLTAPP